MREIRLPQPSYAYRFDLLLAFARRIAFPARMLAAGDTLWRYTCGIPLAYRQECAAIIVRGDIPAGEHARVEAASRRILGLDRDLGAFYSMARRHEQLWRLIEPLHGLPIFCSETVFEALITLIIEQHISWKSALRSQSCLLRLLSPCTSVAGGRIYDFPGPSKLAGATRGMLKPLKITNRRIDQIIDTAAAVAGGQLDLEAIDAMPAEQAYQSLLALKGVGPWTAGNVIGRATGKYPHLSQGDVALQAAVRRYFHADKGEKSARQVRDTLAPFAEYAGLAGHFTLLRWVLDNYPVVDAAGPGQVQAPSSS